MVAGTRANNFLVARVTTAGALDLAFGGGDGFETLDVNNAAGNSDQGTSVAIDSAGRIVVAGYTGLAANQERFAVARFTSAGLLDTSFSNDIPTPGRNIVDMSSAVAPEEQSLGLAVAILPGDRVLTAGTGELTGLDEEVALLALDAAGNLDVSFSGDGKAYAGLGASSERATAVKLDANGRIVIAGRTLPLVGDSQAVAGRFLANGAPDNSFGGDGLVTTDLGPGDDNATGVALDKAGRSVAGGYLGPFAGAEWEFARYEGVPRCGGQIPTIVGTAAKDKLKGTKGKDVIAGGTGKDKILGLGGKDVLCGEDGKDILLGGGKDRLIGGKGRDVLKGGKGKDKLKGGPGKDKQVQ